MFCNQRVTNFFEWGTQNAAVPLKFYYLFSAELSNNCFVHNKMKPKSASRVGIEVWRQTEKQERHSWLTRHGCTKLAFLHNYFHHQQQEKIGLFKWRMDLDLPNTSVCNNVTLHSGMVLI